ncbi:hypothetical protein P2G88_13365 [Aliiglaciecola sp. CAU 1673]|uniref:hypothetical protein n=1 Tax=Aliiglaciecola sp. CAU 1673 TaxID=3032595 RepID=UPI0023DC6FE7|nr:hypothetical protein [Aliiglaciecola sp. CAU 1673]MDF2179243.1 hypothetical protein [Aliiglaciecola sp. CAU 1673]
MPIQLDASMSSAVYSGVQGLNKASQGIAQNSANIAQQPLSASASSEGTPSNAANLTTEVVGLSTNLTYAQANARVVEVANEMVGRLINETA